MAKAKKPANTQEAVPEPSSGNTDNHMQQLLQSMQDNLQHANNVINQTLAQSQSLMQQVMSNEQQASAAPQGAPAEAAPAHSPIQGVDAVQAAVQQAANHEQGLLGKLNQSAQQHLQQSGAQAVPGESLPTDSQNYLGAVSNALHGNMDNDQLQQMQHTANQHIQDAEQAMQHSLNNIHQAVENQRKVFEQQFAQPPVTDPSAPAPQADGEQTG